MKLNLGCGDHYAPGWVNVDTVDCPHKADIRADITKPFPSGFTGVTHVYMGHVLEHLSMDDAVLVLHRVADVLEPGGGLLVVGPDADRAYAMRERGELTRREYEGVVHGRRAWSGDEHRWMCNEEVIQDLVNRTGRFKWTTPIALDDIPSFWPVVSFVEWQCAVIVTAKGDQ